MNINDRNPVGKFCRVSFFATVIKKIFFLRWDRTLNFNQLYVSTFKSESTLKIFRRDYLQIIPVL